MKEIEDKTLRDLLKDVGSGMPDNPLFVRKVMNRLPEPEDGSYAWVQWLVYGLVLTLCLVGWVLLIMSGNLFDWNVPATGTGIIGFIPAPVWAYLLLAGVTGIVIFQIVQSALGSDS